MISPVHSTVDKKSKGNESSSPQGKTKADPNQIEISLGEGARDSTKEVLLMESASFFFDEYNKKYTANSNDVSHMISDVNTDPSKPPVPGINSQYITWKLRRLIENIYFRIITFFLILLDIIIVTVDLILEGVRELQILDLVLSIYFVIEVTLRIIVLRPKVFFRRWYNVLDFIVIIITSIISFITITNASEFQEGLSILSGLRLRIFRILRFLRILRVLRIYAEEKNLETAARQLISQNKRRYQQDGFDLDLTYVTNKVIATSFPSSGLWAVYRNPIRKVAHFLNTKHAERYKLFNLCSEKTYDTSFFHERVERVMIDDHNVPSVEQMIKFADTVRAWLSEHPDNVIVVHCKGGKGRTGTMICVWLIESGVFSSAALSLDYFGNRRTDTNVSKKFQGVETPSQSRYVGYYEWVKNNGRVMPDSAPLKIKKIIISGMKYIGKGDGSDFWVDVDQGRGNTVFNAVFGTQKNCAMQYISTSDTLKVTIFNCPTLTGDIKVLFQTSSTVVPKNYEKCPFYFWFNTGFVTDKQLELTRDELDNPHKNKTWHCFRESFSVKLVFE